MARRLKRVLFVVGVVLTACADTSQPTSKGDTAVALAVPPSATQVAPARDCTECHVTAQASVEAQVHAVCSRCHLAPKPDILTKDVWKVKIPAMLQLAGEPGVPSLAQAEVDLALGWYLPRAPDRLALTPPAPKESASLRFRVERVTPDEHERAPMIGGLAVVQGKLLVADAKTSALFRLDLSPLRLVPIAGGLKAPVHIAPILGERTKLIIGSLGSITPSNETAGSVSMLVEGADGRYTRGRRLIDGLGRVAAARPVDFDEDGDPDIVVTAFGWRGPGELLILENRDEQFVKHRLDDRDGYIHAEPADFDGDGKLDFAALLSQEHEQVIVYLNRGGLQFEPKVLWRAPHPAWGYSGLQVVDLDGDGDPDVLVSNGDTLDDHILKPDHGVDWLENRGGMNFVRHRIAAVPACERAVAGDMDGDGDQDVVAVSFMPQYSAARRKALDCDAVLWFEQTKAGWVRHSIEKHECVHPSLLVDDLDGDGRLDIAAGSYVWHNASDGKPSFFTDFVTLFLSKPLSDNR